MQLLLGGGLRGIAYRNRPFRRLPSFPRKGESSPFRGVL